MTSPLYKRVLLKLSGEALMGEDQFGINRASIEQMVGDVVDAVNLGVEMAIVIGGGNIFRGVAPGAEGMDRATADYMGMLATGDQFAGTGRRNGTKWSDGSCHVRHRY